MYTPIGKKPLDAAVAAMEKRWEESGIPDLYQGGDGPVSRERARNVRALLYPKPKLAHGAMTSTVIPGVGGEIPICIIRPVSGDPIGTAVYFHGGGWVVGDLESHEGHAIRLANRAGTVVVLVDYRLAPEHRFPAAVEDAETASTWAANHLADLGGMDRPLAVAGDSAGANLAAVAAIHCRDNRVELAAQLLMYPPTNLVGMTGPELSYLGEDAGIKARDPRASPLLSASLAGLAPAIIGVGMHDFLYEDSMKYAAALRAAGVPVLLREYEDLNHGFFSYTAISSRCEAAADQLCDDLRQQLLTSRGKP